MPHDCHCGQPKARAKSAWELLAEAQAEAARNAEIPPLRSASAQRPEQPAAQPAAQGATGYYTMPVAAPHAYYGYSVTHPI